MVKWTTRFRNAVARRPPTPEPPSGRLECNLPGDPPRKPLPQINLPSEAIEIEPHRPRVHRPPTPYYPKEERLAEDARPFHHFRRQDNVPSRLVPSQKETGLKIFKNRPSVELSYTQVAPAVNVASSAGPSKLPVIKHEPFTMDDPKEAGLQRTFSERQPSPPIDTEKRDSGVSVPDQPYEGKGIGRATKLVDLAPPIADFSINRPEQESTCSLAEAYFIGRAKFEQELEIRKRARNMAFEAMLAEQRKEKIELKERMRLQAKQRKEEEERNERLLWKLLERESQMRDCTVCSDAKEASEFLSQPATSGCNHDVTVCSDCMQTWLATEIEAKGSNGINCPECSEILEHGDVQRNASAETFATFEHLLIRSTVSDSEDFAWCLAPGCTSGQENIDNSNFMCCSGCGFQQCLEHKIPWHIGETCSDYDGRLSSVQAREQERMTQETLMNTSKMCPGPRCGWRIEKIEGCDHMQCRRCRHKFCWQCLVSHQDIVEGGNSAHKPECRYHSAAPQLSWPFNAHR